MKNLPTEPYKGVRDFYPDDMLIQQHIFEVWSKTAEAFGFQRYDASILEPADLYKAKGAENEEMVNEQTYTFTDRGGREVTLRPEMTPTVARMIAGKRKELSLPVRWYSIPNLFRYERTQRGRVREHWQLNCDIFGSDDVTAEIEIIALAYQTLINFGATPDMFEIRLNNRQMMTSLYNKMGINNEITISKLTRLNDRKSKITDEAYKSELLEILGDEQLAKEVKNLIEEDGVTDEVFTGLQALGIENIKIDRSLARGFDYYTGTIFEIFDTADENNRSMLGGGRYDNLTSLFGGEAVSGVGFGMGDVTMRDFLETHKLLSIPKSASQMVIIPTEAMFNLEAEKLAMSFRRAGLSVLVDISSKKLGKKISTAALGGTGYVVVIGEDEVSRQEFVVKNLADGTETSGTIDYLIKHFSL